MPTPNIYRKIQKNLERYRPASLVGSVVSYSIFAWFLISTKETIENMSASSLYLALAICSIGMILSLFNLMAGYQQKSWIDNYPITAKLGKLLPPKPKPWSEAIAINCFALGLILVITVLFLNASGF